MYSTNICMRCSGSSDSQMRKAANEANQLGYSRIYIDAMEKGHLITRIYNVKEVRIHGSQAPIVALHSKAVSKGAKDPLSLHKLLDSKRQTINRPNPGTPIA